MNHEYPPLGGGSAVATKNLAEALVRGGDQAYVLTAGPESRRHEEHGVQIETLPVPVKSGKLASLGFWLAFSRKVPAALTRVIEDFRPDVINSHFLIPSGYAVARTRTKIPHIASTVGADVHDPTRSLVAVDKNPVIRRLAKRVTKHARAITAPSSDMHTRIMQVFGSNLNVHTLPWPVPPIAEDSRTRSDLNIDSSRFVIAALCRLVRRKRLDVLLQAIAKVKDLNPLLVVMGYGPQEQELRDLADQLDISANVLFTGMINEADKAAYLQQADLFCLASEHEAFGLVFVEAMSLSTPVIASTVGGQTDIIEEGLSGFLVQPGDAQAIAERIRQLSSDPQLLTKLKQAAKLRSAAYAPDAVAMKFRELFQWAVEDGSLQASR